MIKTDINEIIEVFEKDTDLFIGLMPNIKKVIHGYYYNDIEFIIYLQPENEVIDIIKNIVETEKTINFIKWSDSSKIIQGNGDVVLLETDEEKINGLNYIVKQTGKNNNYDVNKNDIKDLIIIKLKVENVYLINNSKNYFA